MVKQGEPKKNQGVRGELLVRALELLGDAAMTTAEFIGVLLTASKSDSRALHNVIPSDRSSSPPPPPPRFTKQQLYNLLYRMERDGLTTRRDKKSASAWKLTVKGLFKRDHRPKHLLLPSPTNYHRELGTTITIVSYDIPEKEASKRLWLRTVLTHLGFRLLHKSVWIGKNKIPHEFVEDVQRLHLIDHIEIFSIEKSGTIRHLA